MFFCAIACAGGEKTVVEPPPPGNTDFTINVRVEDAENAVSQKLGWASGIPTADVTLVGSDGQGQTVSTNSSGSVSFPNLKDGKYAVSVRRILNAQELAKVVGTDVVGFVFEDSISSSTTVRTATLSTLASRRKSIVLSEWSGHPALTAGLSTYYNGSFMELYNNSDTTVYLDGVIFAEEISDPVEFPSFSCASLASFRNDPLGAWGIYLSAFPGNGRDYPLQPGATTVIATDAIDHRPILPGLLDLSNANFEWFGNADVDNPQVPNMIDLGLKPYDFGHGMSFAHSVLATVTVIASPLDTRTLLKGTDPSGLSLIRIPTGSILDAFSSRNEFLLDPSQGLIPCPQLVNAAIDRREGIFQQSDALAYTRSANRKALTTLPNGRVVLQDTKMSALDFYLGSRTPGIVTPNR